MVLPISMIFFKISLLLNFCLKEKIIIYETILYKYLRNLPPISAVGKISRNKADKFWETNRKTHQFMSHKCFSV